MSPHWTFALGAVTLALILAGLAGINDSLEQKHKPSRWRRRMALVGANLTLAGAWLGITALNVWTAA